MAALLPLHVQRCSTLLERIKQVGRRGSAGWKHACQPNSHSTGSMQEGGGQRVPTQRACCRTQDQAAHQAGAYVVTSCPICLEDFTPPSTLHAAAAAAFAPPVSGAPGAEAPIPAAPSAPPVGGKCRGRVHASG